MGCDLVTCDTGERVRRARKPNFYMVKEPLVKQSRLSILIITFILGLTAVGVWAQASSNFDVSQHSFASGGQSQSATFLVENAIGQPLDAVVTSPSFVFEAGFLGSVVNLDAGGDSFESDNFCVQAKPLAVDSELQQHTFHREGDQDWIKFNALANKSYIVEVTNLGDAADAVIVLYNNCTEAPVGSGVNAFGRIATLEWDSTKNGEYVVGLQQFDPRRFGSTANYQVRILADNTPPSAPTNPRCLAINETTLGLQWKKSPERDVRKYHIQYAGNVSGNEDVNGGDTTYYELGNLTPNQTYTLRVAAVDYSSNESPQTGAFPCTAKQPDDTTAPSFSLQQPVNSGIYTTTASSLTFTGHAQDATNNLSRAQVRNHTANKEGNDYSLTGGSDDFRVPDVPLTLGDNSIQVSIIDAANNKSTQLLTVRRLGNVSGAVIIIAGHNETFGLQPNIYNAANRAYRIFQRAGFSEENIYYLAPTGQDADGNGAPDVDAATSPTAIEYAVTVWARSRVDPDKPLFMYLIDHGLTEQFCASGCNSGPVSAKSLDSWLRTLETATGVDAVTIVMEACQSGSFIDREGAVEPVENSLSKAGRVIITSTGRVNNAYASAAGAYFSDAFFSCLTDSNDLKSCYNEGKAALNTAGVAQTPWLDDTGDGISDAGDGTVAQKRIITQFFSSMRPVITQTALDRQGGNGTLSAMVNEGAEEVTLVYATVYPPNFQEPTDVTLNLNVPTVRLEKDPQVEGKYVFPYINGFPEQGDYRIVFYAQDRLGINATPKLVGESLNLYLPLVAK